MSSTTLSLAAPRAQAALRAWPAVLPVLLLAPWVLLPPLNHDVAGVLSFSQRWLGGERLYVDLIDVNPPLIYVLNLLPAALARWTGLDAVLALQACLLAWAAWVWALALRLRDPHGGALEGLLLAVLPGLVLFGAGYDFGQRDPMMAASAIPYLYAAARRLRGEAPRRRIAAALLAGLGFALKPYFLGIPLLVELAVLAARRRAWLRDPVPWTMLAVWLAYLASLPLLFAPYLTRVLPMIWGLYLDLSGLSLWDTLLAPRLGTAALLLVPLAWWAFRGGAALPRLLALAALGALAAAVAQRKGWSYHIVPLEEFNLALASLLAARFLDSLGATARVAAPRLAAALGLVFVAWTAEADEAPWNELTYRESDVAGLVGLLRQQAEGGRVLVLSPQVSPIFPALNYVHATLTLPTMNMWMLEGSYRTCPADGRRYRAPEQMSPSERAVFDGVARDFVKAPPAVVIVDKYPGIPDCHDVAFDFLAYFSRNPAFAAAWAQYRPSGEWGRFRLFARRR